MNTIIQWTLVGFLAGFAVEYLVDLFWWRRKLQRANGRTAHYESLMQDQNGEIDYLRNQVGKVDKSLDEHEAYIRKLEYELEGSRLQLSDLRVQQEAAEARSKQFQADATILRKQLNQQRDSPSQGGDSEDKRKLARYKKALQAAYTENKRLVSALNSKETLLTTSGNGVAGHQIKPGTVTAAAPAVESYKNLKDSNNPADQLEDISGIGAVYAERLRAAGIRTFSDLSKMRAERLTDIIQPQKWQRIEPDRWIAEAADRVGHSANAAEL